MPNEKKLKYLKALFSLPDSLVRLQYYTETVWQDQREMQRLISDEMNTSNLGSDVAGWIGEDDSIQTIYSIVTECERQLKSIAINHQDEKVRSAALDLKKQIQLGLDVFCKGLGDSIAEVHHLRDECELQSRNGLQKHASNLKKHLHRLETSRGYNEGSSILAKMKKSRWFYGELIKIQFSALKLLRTIPEDRKLFFLGYRLSFRKYLLQIKRAPNRPIQYETAFYRVELNEKLNNELLFLSKTFLFLEGMKIDLSCCTPQSSLKIIDNVRKKIVAVLGDRKSSELLTDDLGIIWDKNGGRRKGGGLLKRYLKGKIIKVELPDHQAAVFDIAYGKRASGAVAKEFEKIWINKTTANKDFQSAKRQLNIKLRKLQLQLIRKDLDRSKWFLVHDEL